ncbi:MAG: stage 0 sporulation family protein [Clostridia bacterium]|nr:stage 0 sporulation family protein [Clostridia bacterium]
MPHFQKTAVAAPEITAVKKPASEYEAPRFVLPESYLVKPEEVQENEKVRVAGVRFKDGGKVYFFDPGDFDVKPGDHVIVETARGIEYGEAVYGSREVSSIQIISPLKSIIRMADENDAAHRRENGIREKEAFGICEEMILHHGLEMKLVDVEYTFDNTKMLFYFTSESRVDFRDLVKDLASVFKTRIELRQIGIRDEAKMIGGLGVCGRPVCCHTFLDDFGQVSIKMAKEQNLSLNTAKISGTCGRLMCCLRYEHETYEEEIRKTPRIDSLVRTDDGDGVVVETMPLQGLLKVQLSATPDAAPKVYDRDSVKLIGYVKKEIKQQTKQM